MVHGIRHAGGGQDEGDPSDSPAVGEIERHACEITGAYRDYDRAVMRHVLDGLGISSILCTRSRSLTSQWRGTRGPDGRVVGPFPDDRGPCRQALVPLVPPFDVRGPLRQGSVGETVSAEESPIMSNNHHRNHEPRGTETWRVEVQFEHEHDDTVATVDLFVGDAEYEAHGHTHAGQLDAAVARQLAVARALSGLAHQLVDDAARRVDRVAQAVATAADQTADAYMVLDQ